METICSNSLVIKTYKDGLGVFLYDEMLVDEIQASGAVILDGFSGAARVLRGHASPA